MNTATEPGAMKCIAGDDDDFADKKTKGKAGLLRFAQKGVSNTKDLKVCESRCE